MACCTTLTRGSFRDFRCGVGDGDPGGGGTVGDADDLEAASGDVEGVILAEDVGLRRTLSAVGDGRDGRAEGLKIEDVVDLGLLELDRLGLNFGLLEIALGGGHEDRPERVAVQRTGAQRLSIVLSGRGGWHGLGCLSKACLPREPGAAARFDGGC